MIHGWVPPVDFQRDLQSSGTASRLLTLSVIDLVFAEATLERGIEVTQVKVVRVSELLLQVNSQLALREIKMSYKSTLHS